VTLAPGDVLSGRFRVTAPRSGRSDRRIYDAVDLLERRPVRVEWPRPGCEPPFAEEDHRARAAFGRTGGLWLDRGRWYRIAPRRACEVDWSDLRGLDVTRALSIAERLAWALDRHHRAAGPHGAVFADRVRVSGDDVALDPGLGVGTVADDLRALADRLAEALGAAPRDPWDTSTPGDLPVGVRAVLRAWRSDDPADRPRTAAAAALTLRRLRRRPHRVPVPSEGPLAWSATHQVRRLDADGTWDRVGPATSGARASRLADGLRARGETVDVARVALGPSDAARVLLAAVLASPVPVVGPVVAATLVAAARRRLLRPAAACTGDVVGFETPRARPPVAFWTLGVALWLVAAALAWAPGWAFLPALVALGLGFVLWAPDRPLLVDAVAAARWSAALAESELRTDHGYPDVDRAAGPQPRARPASLAAESTGASVFGRLRADPPDRAAPRHGSGTDPS
jgi:hypothetical protein